ncbi:MAG TPA: Gfo/Idh/MocA family oxidoreductase [Planctomycetota bacterium]|nr:Gfo/Idh/MocA family oxidoreductase [Planctomycetota bacterium]
MGEGKERFGYGLIGAGSFGLFCLEQYRSMPGLKLSAVADADAARACEAGRRFGLDVCETPAELLGRDDVDVVHVATPPATHRTLCEQALSAGKHVLCEKPLATTLEDARAVAAAAGKAGRLLAVNLVMRYDPVCALVKRLIDDGLLGEPLHGFFENYAKDEPLPPEHWFWDRTQSGGIFIEHAVHFFDLFEWWLGKGDVASAHAEKRPDTELVEHVNATALYPHGVIVNFYHGFHQASRMDRQEMRIVFERGVVTLEDWVPTRLRIDAIVDDATLDALRELMPGARVPKLEVCDVEDRSVTSRHKPYVVDQCIQMTFDLGMTKTDLYGHVLRALLADQLAAVRNPDHECKVTAANGVRSLEMAVEADRLTRVER